MFPKLLQRYGIPSAITSLVLGFSVGWRIPEILDDPTLRLLSTLGITTLFLFAGLEVDGRELLHNRRVLIQHVVVQLLVLGILALGLCSFIDLPWRSATILALAVATPSTGFILDSLDLFGLDAEERFWVKSKAIGTELVALGTLFVVVQAASWQRLLFSSAALLGLVILLPLAFRAFAAWIRPHAKRSEFAFLIMIAVLCAFLTRKLGVYYLVGAFLAGIAAQSFRSRLPSIASEEIVHATRVFASVFVPFYFFGAGLHVPTAAISWHALGLGLLLIVVALPLRGLGVISQRFLALGESPRLSMRIASALSPTLVFTLVLAELLRNEFALSTDLYGALVIFAVGGTFAPTLLLRTPAADVAIREFESEDAGTGTGSRN